MPVRSADATWSGDLQKGNGSVRLGSGAWEGQYTFDSRFEDGSGTNPEELVAAAHAGCFSMALANQLASAGYEPERISTTAEVHLTKTSAGFSIPQIDLRTDAQVPGISDEEFQRLAMETKSTCPISQLVRAADINLEAKLSG